MFEKVFRSTALAFALLAAPQVSVAKALDQPTGTVVLTITGDLAVTNRDGMAVFDIEMLRAIGEETIQTTTIWTDGPQSFTGVPLAALLSAVGAKTGTVTAIALNDYSCELDVVQEMSDKALLAFERNGQPMSVREKGPLWIVYPYDSDPRYQSEVYYSRSIWQLDRMQITN